MAEAKKLTQKEYEAIRADYEKRYGYDSRSDEEKGAFDKKFDEHYQTDKKAMLLMTIQLNLTKILTKDMSENENVADVDSVR